MDRSMSPNQRAWRRLRQSRVAIFSGLFLLAMILLVSLRPGFERPGIASRLPHAMTWPPAALSDAQFQPPSAAHWFGTDIHGRDLLSRILYGARLFFFPGGGW